MWESDYVFGFAQVDVNMLFLYVVAANDIHSICCWNGRLFQKRILGWVNPADVGCIPTFGASKRKDGKHLQVTGNFFETRTQTIQVAWAPPNLDFQRFLW